MSTRDRLLKPLRAASETVSRELSKRVVLGSIALGVVVLTVIPLLFLAWTAVWSGFPGQFSASFTLRNLEVVYLEGFFDVPDLFFNSVLVATGMTTTGLVFGVTFAWLLVRTNVPTKAGLELTLLSGLAIPGYIFAITYVVAYGPENGLVTTFLEDTFGFGLPISVYSPWGIAFILGIHVVSTCYLLTVPALQDMDPALEEVSRIHGASITGTLRSVTLPLIKPAILSATVVIFLYGIGEFAIIAILGSRRGFDVYSTEIWDAVSSRFPPAHGEAAALACSLLLVMLVLVWYYRHVTARKEDFMTLSGQSYQPQPWDLGKWRWPIAAVLWLVLLVVRIIPIFVLVLASLHASWLGGVDLSNLTISYYVEALTDEGLREAFVNSVIVALGGATLGTVLVVGMAYYTERSDGRFRGVVDLLSLTPLAVPGIIMGSSLLFTFLWVGKVHPILNLYGTLAIITIGCVILFIPISSRIAVGNIVQIHAELEEAARLSGASWLTQMREVFLPLFRNTTVIIWFYLGINIFQLISIPVMTYTTDTVVIPVKLFRLYMYRPNIELVSAISTTFIALTLLLMIVMHHFGIRFYDMGAQ